MKGYILSVLGARGLYLDGVKHKNVKPDSKTQVEPLKYHPKTMDDSCGEDGAELATTRLHPHPGQDLDLIGLKEMCRSVNCTQSKNIKILFATLDKWKRHQNQTKT